MCDRGFLIALFKITSVEVIKTVAFTARTQKQVVRKSSHFPLYELWVVGDVQVKSALICVESNAPLFYRIDLISSVDLFLDCENFGHVQLCCNVRMFYSQMIII